MSADPFQVAHDALVAELADSLDVEAGLRQVLAADREIEHLRAGGEGRDHLARLLADWAREIREGTT